MIHRCREIDLATPSNASQRSLGAHPLVPAEVRSLHVNEMKPARLRHAPIPIPIPSRHPLPCAPTRTPAQDGDALAASILRASAATSAARERSGAPRWPAPTAIA